MECSEDALQRELSTADGTSDSDSIMLPDASTHSVVENTAVVNDEDDDANVVDAMGLTWKKERVAIVFGYIGARFQGLQRNPGAFTVEDEIEGAIFRAGGISSECYFLCVLTYAMRYFA